MSARTRQRLYDRHRPNAGRPAGKRRRHRAGADVGERQALACSNQNVRPLALTALTPRTLSASSTARARSAPLPSLPLRVTTPALVLTSTSEPLTLLEYSRVDLTLVVIQLSAISRPAWAVEVLALSVMLGAAVPTTS